MAVQLFDDNNITDFVDDSGVTLWYDDLGNWIGDLVVLTTAHNSPLRLREGHYGGWYYVIR